MNEQPQDYPPAKDWMRKAAEDIDMKLGLPRSDLAIEFCAKIIARHYLNHLEIEAVTKANAARLEAEEKRDASKRGATFDRIRDLHSRISTEKSEGARELIDAGRTTRTAKKRAR